ncbi:hypothetical protein CHS0354_028901 [Potamilus streckersoni]|uniref:Uncharacterized protein n=1 Tax=Potamilus streckersoni TaxID=2493646 RepID=A0AAE0VTR1_9BIVA|nr:hypothetical protein CHS0354_028901 [Potamilus streckersoni]
MACTKQVYRRSSAEEAAGYQQEEDINGTIEEQTALQVTNKATEPTLRSKKNYVTNRAHATFQKELLTPQINEDNRTEKS